MSLAFIGPTFRSLRIRNYRLFAAGQAVSNTGTWMQRVAQDWLVLELTHNNGSALGITTGLQFLPMLLFSMYGGMIADRYPKRRLLLMAQTSMAALALVLAVLDLTGAVQVWQVWALAFGLGLATAVDNPTRQSFVVEMVGPNDVPNAVGLNSATFNLARIVGPAIAGFLITFVGTGPVFLINAASYVAVLTGIALMRDGELFLTSTVARARGQLREGLRYVRARPDLLLPIIIVGFVGTFGLNFQITIALMSKEVFGRSAAAYGLLSTALAVGSLTGALLAAKRGAPRQRLVVGAAIVFGVFEVVTGLMPTYVTFGLLLIPTGVFALTVSTAANASIQLAVSPAMRGRVMALYLLVFTGGTPFGAPMIGWLAEAIGPRWSLLIGGAVSAAAAVIAASLLARKRGLVVRAHILPRPHVDVLPQATRDMPTPDHVVPGARAS